MTNRKKMFECYDQWDNPQTYAFADFYVEPDDYCKELNYCSSVDDFKDKVRSDVANKVNLCKQDASSCDVSDLFKVLLTASVDTINVNCIVNCVAECYARELKVIDLESRMNRICAIMESRNPINEKGTTPSHDGDLAAMDIALNFKKDEVDVDSAVDVENKKDAWILKLVYNDGSQEDLSLVKPDEDKRNYTIKSNKDKLNVKFSDKDFKDKSLSVPQSVIDHIAKHIEQAEANNDKDKKNNNKDLAKDISYEIKKEFPNYDMEVIEGDTGSNRWTIEIVYKDGNKDHFGIMNLGGSYVIKSNDGFIAKYTLDELKNFPSKLKDHIEQHAKKSKR